MLESKGLNLDALGRSHAGGDEMRERFPPFPTGNSRQGRHLKICVASHDFVGPIRNGGVGTACTTIAETLARAGHDVTALYVTPNVCETGTIAHWADHYAAKGITFLALPPAPVTFSASFAVSKAYDCLAWLRWRSFDVIHAPELMGALYFCLLAKRQGLAFHETQFVVGTHSPTLWAIQGNRELPSRYEDIERDFLERQCVALADVVWSPSQYLLEWERARGWQFPHRTYVQPYLVPQDISETNIKSPEQSHVSELVFFGRLEERKGLILFCDALDLLDKHSPTLTQRLRVTFLGKQMMVGETTSSEYIQRRSLAWSFPIQVERHRDRKEALEFLSRPGCVAIMPSLMDNSPLAVVECLAAGIPFLASTAGGIPELIAPDFRDTMLVPLRADHWARAIERVLTNGAQAGRLALDPMKNQQAWIDWHAQLETPAPAPESSELDNPPLVSVCVAHRDRPAYLSQAIESLRRQDYPRLEVILVDDASNDDATHENLDALEEEFARRHWRLIRRPHNHFACAARNLASSVAKGEYLLFMDDDNVAKPHEISTLVKAARHSGADVVTCFHDAFRGATMPRTNQAPELRFPFLGPAVALGLWTNALGDTNMLIRSNVFRALGRFTEEFGVGHEDRELLARAVLQGYHLQVVPEALFWYRLTPASLSETTSLKANQLRAIRPYLEAVPEAIRPALLLAQGLLDRAISAEQFAGQCVGPPPPPIALRYRLADRLNGIVKSVPFAHPVAKSIVRLGRRAWIRARRGKPHAA